MKAKIKIKRGTTAQWALNDPILADGEPGWDTDLRVMKIGNGVLPWSELIDAEALSDSAEVSAESAAASSEAAAASAQSAAASATLADGVAAERITELDADPTSDFRVQQDARLANMIDTLVITKTGVAMAAWFTSLISTTGARWVGIGDSTMEGSGRSAIADRWPNLINADLRTTLGLTGGPGYVPAFSSTSVPDLWTASGGTTEGATTASAAGLGSKALTIPATEYAEYAWTGTSFRLHYYSGGSTGTIQISVDGGAAVEVDTGGSGGSLTYSSGALTAGAHTVRVTTKAATSACYLQGGTFYNGDEPGNPGLIYYDAAHAGITAQTVAANLQCLDQLTVASPHLVMIDLGINDYRANRTPAQLKADLNTIVARVKAKVACSILLVAPHEPAHAGTPVSPWSDYVTAIRDTAANDVGIALFDVYALGNNLGWNNDPNNYLSDEGTPGPGGNLHLSVAGEDFYRDQFLTYFGAGQSPQSLASIAAVGPTAQAYIIALANTWAAKQTLSAGADINGNVLLNALLDLRTSTGQVWIGNNRKIRGNTVAAALTDMLFIGTNDKVTLGASTNGTSVLGSSVGFLGSAGSARRGATADATDLATAITLVNALKADLIAYGLKTA